MLINTAFNQLVYMYLHEPFHSVVKSLDDTLKIFTENFCYWFNFIEFGKRKFLPNSQSFNYWGQVGQ